ncbi:hypothetical protein NHL50_19920 [Acidimicrobiia bacterium EGI L10123]|uniref:hypothetical protein n=1 Tax=Salinilacustrithrix flava TaxID=2957203 RepID=UPI003D7C2D76|nr:hypothetical protein [Acidimicrobiia bacterium EGI L10123]
MPELTTHEQAAGLPSTTSILDRSAGSRGVHALTFPAIAIAAVVALRGATDAAGDAVWVSGINANGLIALAVTFAATPLILRSQKVLRSAIVVLAILLYGALRYGTEFNFDQHLQGLMIRLMSVFAVWTVAVLTTRYAPGRARALLEALLVVASIIAIVTLLDAASAIGSTPLGQRATTPFIHPNSAGLFYALALTMRYAIKSSRFGRRNLQLAVLTLALLTTGSITALICSGIAITYVSTAGSRSRRYGRRAPLLVGALAALALFQFSPAGEARVDELRRTSVQTSESDTSFEWRLINWELSLADSNINSRWWGDGLGAADDATRQPLGRQPHSEVVRSLIEYGRVGTLAIGMVLLYNFARLHLAGRREATAIFIVLTVSMLTSNTLNYTPALYLSAALFGCLAWPSTNLVNVLSEQ